ncbi:DUF6891 domain-containing protein [Antribacter gilvus]|uniref:DUF6891 domain-containing protein n=1 Tax=Antribacter gilvus TaxID=2304675 RepID=UPI000F79C4A0|nr:hypothetical protein [Antribacter gilvus]
MSDVQQTVEDVVALARDHARAQIRTGFWSYDEVLESTVRLAMDEVDDADLSLAEGTVERVVQQEWAARLTEQADWEDEGDFARLAAAFEELERKGVVARMNFTCCQTCGHAEILEEVPAAVVDAGGGAAAPGGAAGPWAYTFFHQQDADDLGDAGSRLHLAFGAFGDVAVVEKEVAAGREVVDTLARHGFDVDWDGTNRQRPAVAIREWRKRLPV